MKLNIKKDKKNYIIRDGFYIGHIFIKNGAILAPMAGFSDRALRQISVDCGAVLTYTEMISCKGLVYENKKTFDMLTTTIGNVKNVVQLFGSNPIDFEKAIKHKSKVLDKYDIIDINMGCPVKKVYQNGEGSALMEDFDKASEIIKACVKASDGRPVSVKFRIGVHIGDNIAFDFAKMCEQSGAKFVAIHGRYARQMYSGKSDWDTIENVAKNIGIPVVASGDIKSEDIACYTNQTDKEHNDTDKNQNNVNIKNSEKESFISGIMIGREAIGNPLIFMQAFIKANLHYYNATNVFEKLDKSIVVVNENNSNVCKINKQNIMKKHFEYMINDYGYFAAILFRKYYCNYLRGSKKSRDLKESVNKATTVKEIIELIEKIDDDFIFCI